MGLGWATLAVFLALFRVPGPAAPRPDPPSGVVFDGRFPAAFRLSPGAGDFVSEPARELHFQVGGILVVDGGS